MAYQLPSSTLLKYTCDIMPMKSFPLLRLPREMRDQILEDVLFPRSCKRIFLYTQGIIGQPDYKYDNVVPDWSNVRSRSAILSVCKQLCDEGYPVLYGKTDFRFRYSVLLMHSFLKTLRHSTTGLIRQITIIDSHNVAFQPTGSLSAYSARNT